MESLGAIGHAIMVPLYYVISVVLVGFHKFWSLIFDPDSGAAWVLSIVGLTLVIRACLIPLFVKQIKSSRNMQLIQPEVKKLQEKYGHDRERMSQETMKLYKDTGTNPFSSCLPILVQMPIFLALFRLLDQAAGKGIGHGVLNAAQTKSFAEAELFGVPIAGTFLRADGDWGTIVMATVFILAMIATTFTTQKQLMSKNMPAASLEGPFAQQQKIMLYVLPLVFGIGGIAFPIGVLVYWTTSNFWTMGQQFYVIRNNPAPNTPAYDAKVARDVKKGKGPKADPELGGDGSGSPATPLTGPGSPGNGGSATGGNQRQQPKKKPRSQRKPPPGSNAQGKRSA